MAHSKETEHNPYAGREVHPAPSPILIKAARDAMHNFMLHFHQLLLFNGYARGPEPYFKISLSQDLFLEIECVDHPDYNFSLRTVTMPIEEIDAFVLNNLGLIRERIAAGAEKMHPSVCCPLAEEVPCVCMISYVCDIHGSKCIGSHD